MPHAPDDYCPEDARAFTKLDCLHWAIYAEEDGSCRICEQVRASEREWLAAEREEALASAPWNEGKL